MTKRAEFHQAIINVQFRIVDDDRSYGLHNAQVIVLLDKDRDWQLAITQIQDAMHQLNEDLQGANSN
jgi:hypothetical protein